MHRYVYMYILTYIYIYVYIYIHIGDSCLSNLGHGKQEKNVMKPVQSLPSSSNAVCTVERSR